VPRLGSTSLPSNSSLGDWRVAKTTYSIKIQTLIKQYVRDHLILRTEAAGNNVTDYGVNKAVEHLPALRDKLSGSITIT